MPFVRAITLWLCAAAIDRSRRVAGSRRRSVLQGQAAHPADQLRGRRSDRHRRAHVRQASCAAHRRSAQHRDPEHGRRRRRRRRQIHGRGGAARRHHGGLFHRHRVHLCARSGALPRRLQDLRVRRDAGRHHRAFRAHRRAARHEGGDRHRQGEGPDRRRPERRHLEGHPHAARLRHAGHPATNTSPAIARARRRGSRCSAARSISSRNRRRAIAASSSPAWSRPGR